jgi:amino acid adenylation domain-containing protein
MSTSELDALSAEGKRELLATLLRARNKRPRRFPASFSQQRLWFLDQLAPGSAAYNVPGAVRIHGPLDLDAWRRSCNDIARRHEALRTTFEEVDGQPVQVIAEVLEPEFTVVECGHLRGPGGEAGIQALAREEFARPFDLRSGPLLRVRFLRLSPDEHVLLLTMCHIVADLWSTSVAIAEMVALYETYGTGREAALPTLPIQYADYAVWQRQQIEGDGLTADLEYWTQALAGAPPALELPTDRPRPEVQGTRGGSCPFRLPEPAAGALRAIGRAENATPFMTLLAAFLVLLHRYSGNEDVVVGVPVANRGRPEIERLIGYFVNMLALRNDLSGNPSFRELLARVRRTSLSGFAHQQLPFGRLVGELRPPRDLSRSPVFQVSFVFQNIALPDFDLPGLRLEPFDVESGTARFDLELQVFDRPDGMTGWFEYNSDLFDAATVERMARHLAVLAGSLAADPDRPVALAPMVTPDEAELVRTHNATGRVWTGPLLSHQRFTRQAALTPAAEAVRGEDGGWLTYAELDRRSDVLAARLAGLGVGPGALAGICLERSADMVVTLLAVLKAGGAFVPLDPGFPPERIAYMLADSGLAVLVSQRSVMDSLTPSLGDIRAAVVCLDEPGGEPGHAPAHAAGPDDLAYVIYTSGSTGRPKGVQVTHGALGNFLKSMAERPGISPSDTLLAVTTLSFDIAMLELLLPLTEGARVVLASRDTAADGRRLAALIAASDATLMQATPSTWRMLLDAGWDGRPGLRALAGGEALPAELSRRLRSRVASLWNMYGPTETTIWSSVAQVGDGPVTLGEPIANTELHILDAAGQPAPLGVPGELHIGGAGLARGYLGRPGLTAERFIPAPGGARLYRTGDQARRRADGSIDFLGRLDHQVKLRGFRVELGEIETLLERHPAVGHAVTVIREDTPGDQRLIAYVVPAAGHADSPQDTAARLRPELVAALSRQLPGYMIPSAFVFLDAPLPMTPNGKVDRKALPAPDTSREAAGAPYRAPRNPVEEVIAGIWAEVLGVDQVGVLDDFFALGGHSLLSTRIIARVRDAFGVEVPLQRVFAEPTVAGLSAALRQEGGPDGAVDRTAELLVRLSALSDDQVEQALGAGVPGNPGEETRI